MMKNNGSSDIILARDNISMNDTVQHHGFWAKTQIIGGYGLHRNKYGVSELDEVVFDTTNMVPIGGVQFAMEMIFGTKGSLTIPTLNSKGFGASEPINSDGALPYPYGQKVCLFGIGTGGAESNNITALEVKYNESDITDMIPFRYTNDTLTDSEQTKYYGKKTVNNITAYYLKRFDANSPRILHLYKDGEDFEDGSEVDDTVFTNPRDIGIESFTECNLTITKKDAREWFSYNGEIEQCRLNSIALFSAVYNPDSKDYSNIQLFSKLNIPTEPLSLTKDMNIIYRVYGS